MEKHSSYSREIDKQTPDGIIPKTLNWDLFCLPFFSNSSSRLMLPRDQLQYLFCKPIISHSVTMNWNAQYTPKC